MPYVLGLPSYIWDTTDLFKHIKGIHVLSDGAGSIKLGLKQLHFETTTLYSD